MRGKSLTCRTVISIFRGLGPPRAGRRPSEVASAGRQVGALPRIGVAEPALRWPRTIDY